MSKEAVLWSARLLDSLPGSETALLMLVRSLYLCLPSELGWLLCHEKEAREEDESRKALKSPSRDGHHIVLFSHFEHEHGAR